MTTRGSRLYRSGELDRRAREARRLLRCCRLCPRSCGIDRLAGETGVCGSGERAVIASHHAHFGEEQPLVGRHGSGTIFLSGCSLGCCFCQNYEISHNPRAGVEVDADSFAAIMLDLQDQGCHNINFVTPSHVVPQLLAALAVAYRNGLRLPLVYNSSGYDSLATLRMLDGVIDIYLPDYKFWESTSAARYAGAADYPETARAALKEMHRQVGDLVLDRDAIAVHGLLIRHLLMPGGLEESKRILDFIAREVSPAAYVNIMDQYRPCGACAGCPELESTIGPEHYREALDYAGAIGLTRLDRRDLQVLLRHLRII